MSAATVAGIACGEKDLAAYYRHGKLVGAESFDKLICELPADGVAVDVEHNGEQIGEMVYGELDTAGRLGAVAVIDDGDWLLDYCNDGASVYFSPELLVIGEGVATRSRSIATAAGLTALSLTTDPATLAAHPVAVMPGDVRRGSSRWHWPLSWASQHPLLARCVDNLPASIIEAERHRARSIYRERLFTRVGPGFYVDEDGEPVSTQPPGMGWTDFDGRPVGPLRHGPPGRIISVH